MIFLLIAILVCIIVGMALIGLSIHMLHKRTKEYLYRVDELKDRLDDIMRGLLTIDKEIYEILQRLR